MAGNIQIVLLLMLFFPCQSRNNFQTCSQVTFSWKTGLKDRALLDGNLIQAITINNYADCFFKCYKDCRCLSFNVCGARCELNAANSFTTPRLIQKKMGCHFYDQPLDEVKSYVPIQ